MAAMSKRHPDAALIESLGGPAKVAERLKYDKQAGGIQRVQNWMTRGIPAHVKVEFPDLFMRGKRRNELPRSPTNHPAQRATDKKAA